MRGRRWDKILTFGHGGIETNERHEPVEVEQLTDMIVVAIDNSGDLQAKRTRGRVSERGVNERMLEVLTSAWRRSISACLHASMLCGIWNAGSGACCDVEAKGRVGKGWKGFPPAPFWLDSGSMSEFKDGFAGNGTDAGAEGGGWD